jgi:cytoskeletal protein CcmA (bactofilin family)
VLTEDHTLTGVHQGTVHVEVGSFELQGTLQGTLDLQHGVTATIAGVQQGTISIESGAAVTVTGQIQGTTQVSRGGTLVIERGARLAGTLQNDGLVVLRGQFGGAQSGPGEFRVEGSGEIVTPIVRDGMHYYEWS